MPDWSRELWAWQFLRRNPEYQRDYADFIARWREQEPAQLSPGDPASLQPHLAAIQFDLRLSLDEQWEKARKRLAAVRRERANKARLRPRIQDSIPLWQCCLDYLDGKPAAAQCEKTGFTPAFIAEEASRLLEGGYKTSIMMKE